MKKTQRLNGRKFNSIINLIAGVILIIFGVYLMANLAWEFIKFGIGIICILAGLFFLGKRKFVIRI